MIKLSPLNVFKRVLTPSPSYSITSHSIQIEEKINSNEDIPIVTKRVNSELYRKWNKYLYNYIKENVKEIKQTKNSDYYLQFGKHKIYGGLKLWVIKEPSIQYREDMQTGQLYMTARVSFLLSINLKEIYYVDESNDVDHDSISEK